MNNDVSNISAVLLVLAEYVAATGNAKQFSEHLNQNSETFAKNPATGEAAQILQAMSKAAARHIKDAPHS